MTHLRPKRPMTCEEVFGAPEPGNGELNLAALQKGLGLERPLEEKAFLEILRRGKEVLSQESNILKISSEEVVVIGPVRGSYYDMINMMACFTGTKVESDDGYTPTAEEPFTPACQEPITIKDNQVFLFIGDLIDGGHHSSQVLLLLLAIKSMHPDKLYITRGRRESKTDWDEKGHSILLSTELRRKYHFCDHEKLYTECLQVFKTFPIAGVVNANFWCASGGIGPGMQHLNSINRTEDIMKSSHLCDIVWSDPMDDEDEDLQATALFLHNFEKGLAFNYSFNAVMHFLQDNKLKAIIRGVSFTDNRETALQVTRQTHNTTGRPWHFQYSCYDPGYRLFRKSPLNNFPVVMSLFSSPWFLDENENKGAAMLIKDDLVEVKQFTAARRPYALPRMEDGLEWSVPMVAMQATQVVEALWNTISPTEDNPLYVISNKIRSNHSYDKKRAKLLGFQRLCKLVKRKERLMGNTMSLNGLAGFVQSEVPTKLTGKPPVWYQVETFPRLLKLKENWMKIREEAVKVWEAKKILDLHRPSGAWVGQNADDFVAHYMQQEGWIPSYQAKSGRDYKWLNYGLMHNGTAFKENALTCPATTALVEELNKISKVRVCGFSAMHANTSIKPHRDQAGVVDNSLAFHLGLVVPSSTDCYLTVNNEVMHHKEGSTIIFDSTYTHSADNKSNEDRIVLYVDFQLHASDPVDKYCL